MNQRTWIYVDALGQQNVIGLAHSADSGHLVIYCNQRVVTIDFSVLNNKKYSFFLGDELIEVGVEGTVPQFGYTCSVNEEVATPKNKLRQEEKKRESKLFWVGLWAAIAAVTICALYFAF